MEAVFPNHNILFARTAARQSRFLCFYICLFFNDMRKYRGCLIVIN